MRTVPQFRYWRKQGYFLQREGIPCLPRGSRYSVIHPYSWQKDHAKVIPTGNLEWNPKQHYLVKGPEMRYFDYRNGNDMHSGRLNEQKHLNSGILNLPCVIDTDQDIVRSQVD